MFWAFSCSISTMKSGCRWRLARFSRHFESRERQNKIVEVFLIKNKPWWVAFSVSHVVYHRYHCNECNLNIYVFTASPGLPSMKSMKWTSLLPFFKSPCSKWEVKALMADSWSYHLYKIHLRRTMGIYWVSSKLHFYTLGTVTILRIRDLSLWIYRWRTLHRLRL